MNNTTRSNRARRQRKNIHSWKDRWVHRSTLRFLVKLNHREEQASSRTLPVVIPAEACTELD